MATSNGFVGARACVRTESLLLDEPLSALDAKVRLQLREQIRNLQLRLGTTALFVTHDQEEALSMADRVGVIYAAARANRRARRPLRQPEHRICRGVRRHHEPASRHTADGGVVVLGKVVAVQDAGGCPGPDVDVLVRPEGLRVSPLEHGEGIVTGKTFLGSVTRFSVLINQHTSVLVDHPSNEASDIATGTAVHVEIAADTVLIANAMRPSP